MPGHRRFIDDDSQMNFRARRSPAKTPPSGTQLAFRQWPKSGVVSMKWLCFDNGNMVTNSLGAATKVGYTQIKRSSKTAIQRLSIFVDSKSRARRARLRSTNFTIVSNDCWGAEVYKDSNLPFATPLIGTFVAGPCFMRLAADCSRILRTPLSLATDSRYAYVRDLKARKGYFPTGLLDGGNVEIHFVHYATDAEA